MHYTRHHILTLWRQTTIFMSSHPLYLTLWPLYQCHHIHCIYDITQLYLWDHIHYNSRYHIHCTWHDSHCMISQPLHSWHQIPYIWHHVQGLWHLVPYPCDITDTIFVNTYQLYLTSNRRCRDNTTPISEITTSICVSVWSHTLYWW